MRLLFKYKYGSWTIGLSEGTFLNSVLHKLRPLKCPKNEFWADPFIFLYKNKNIFFLKIMNMTKRKEKYLVEYIERASLQTSKMF